MIENRLKAVRMSLIFFEEWIKKIEHHYIIECDPPLPDDAHLISVGVDIQTSNIVTIWYSKEFDIMGESEVIPCLPVIIKEIDDE